jgi:hypothetical protein
MRNAVPGDVNPEPTDQEAGQVLHDLVTTCCQTASSYRPLSYFVPLDARLCTTQLTQKLTHPPGTHTPLNPMLDEN